MKKLTFTVLSMSVLTVMAGAAIAPALGIIGAHFAMQGVSEMTIKLIVSLPALFIILTNLLFTHFANRFTTRTIALVGLFLYVAAGTGCFFADSIILLLFLRALLGVSVGLLMPLSTGLLAYYFPPTQQARLMGLSAAMNQLGGVVATLIAGLLADRFGWQYAFLVYLLGLFVVVFVLLFLPSDSIGKNQSNNTRLLSSLRRFYPCIVEMFLLMLIFFIFPTNFAPMANRDAYLSGHHDLVTAIMAGLDLVALMMGLLFGKMMHWSQRLTMYLFPTLFLLGYGCYCLSQSLLALLIGSLFVGMATGIGVPFINTVAGIKGGQNATATIMPLLSAALYLGQFLSPLVVTPLAQCLFPNWTAGAFAVGCLLSVLLLIQVFFSRKFHSLS